MIYWGKIFGMPGFFVKCQLYEAFMGGFWEGNLMDVGCHIERRGYYEAPSGCISKVCPSWYVEKTPWCLSSVLHTQPYQQNPCGPRNQKNDQQRGRVLQVVPFESLWRSAPTNPGKRWLLWARIENHDFKTITCQWHGPKSVLQTYAVMTNTFCEDKILESLDLGYWRLLRPAFEWPNLAMKKVTALPSRNKSAWVALMLYKDVQSIKCNVDARLIYHILKYKFHICPKQSLNLLHLPSFQTWNVIQQKDLHQALRLLGHWLLGSPRGQLRP